MYLLATIYSQIPNGLEDVSRIEGTTRFGALFRIIFSLSAPNVVSPGIVTFIVTYNEFFFSYIMTDDDSKHWSPLLWSILVFQQRYTVQFNVLAAANQIAMIPIVLLVVLAQRKNISGLTPGVIKD